MPREIKYMLAWVSASFLFIIFIVLLWWLNAANRGGEDLSYGPPANAGVLESPRTPFVVSQSRPAAGASTVALGLPDATRFAALLNSTGVLAELAGEGPYTIFVPTDRAFRLAPKGVVDSLTGAALKRFVEYHVVPNRSVDVNAVDSGTIQALSGDMLNFTVEAGDQSARVNSSVVLEGYSTKNGMVYLINTVLLPPVKK
jgi:uncharacterized surface protein with fasciclin (FAS1) repeats